MQTPANQGGRDPPLCRACNGSGKVEVMHKTPGQPPTSTQEKCQRCQGSGREVRGGYLTK